MQERERMETAISEKCEIQLSGMCGRVAKNGKKNEEADKKQNDSFLPLSPSLTHTEKKISIVSSLD